MCNCMRCRVGVGHDASSEELFAAIEKRLDRYEQREADRIAAAVAQVAKQDSLLAEFTSIVQRQNAERNDIEWLLSELRRTRVERGDALHFRDEYHSQLADEQKRAEAAEAEVARLREWQQQAIPTLTKAIRDDVFCCDLYCQCWKHDAHRLLIDAGAPYNVGNV